MDRAPDLKLSPEDNAKVLAILERHKCQYAGLKVPELIQYARQVIQDQFGHSLSILEMRTLRRIAEMIAEVWRHQSRIVPRTEVVYWFFEDEYGLSYGKILKQMEIEPEKVQGLLLRLQEEKHRP